MPQRPSRFRAIALTFSQAGGRAWGPRRFPHAVWQAGFPPRFTREQPVSRIVASHLAASSKRLAASDKRRFRNVTISATSLLHRTIQLEAEYEKAVQDGHQNYRTRTEITIVIADRYSYPPATQFRYGATRSRGSRKELKYYENTMGVGGLLGSATHPAGNGRKARPGHLLQESAQGIELFYQSHPQEQLRVRLRWQWQERQARRQQRRQSR